MATNLSTKTPGGTDASFSWLLHSSGVGLSTGYQMGQGDGTDTMLWLDLDGIGVKKPWASISKIRTLATVPRIATLPDKTGTLAMLDDLDALTAGQLDTRIKGVSAGGAATTDTTTVLALLAGNTLPIGKVVAIDIYLVLTKGAGVVTPSIYLSFDGSVVDYSIKSEIATNPSGTTYGYQVSSDSPGSAIGQIQLALTTPLPTTLGNYVIRATGFIKIISCSTGNPNYFIAYQRPATGSSVNFSLNGTCRMTVIP